MAEINTVSLSGVLSSDVETSKAKGLTMAEFYIEVEGAGSQRPVGKFKVVAVAEWAEVAKKLSSGDHIVLVGALSERGGEKKDMRDVEIRVRNLIPLPKQIHNSDEWKVRNIDGDDDDGDEFAEMEE